MIRVAAILFCAWLAASPSPASAADEDREAPDAAIADLGDGRYRIGSIVVEKAARRFSVPGRVLHLQDTLEYIAVSRGGVKDYESLLELDTTGSEFMLACILIGLDDEGVEKPRYQFDTEVIDGPRVEVTIGWEKDGKSRSMSAGDALFLGPRRPDEEPVEADAWVFIGSIAREDGTLMAESVGTLIGFVHDPYAIIEHRDGLGIGAYGTIRANAPALPPEGAPVTLSVAVVNQD